MAQSVMKSVKNVFNFGKKKGALLDDVDSSEDDVVPPSYQKLQDGSDDIHKQVSQLKQGGRHARAQSQALHARRRDDALDGAKDIGKELVLMGADAALPGLGSGLGVADQAYGLYEEHQNGGDMGKAVAKEAVMTGAAFIPVVGEFVGIAVGLAKSAKALGQPSKNRTQEKIEQAKELCGKATAHLAKIDDIRAQLEEYDGKDKAKLQSRLDKAEQRLRDAIESTKAWFAKKADHASAPLVAMSEFEDEFGQVFEDQQ